MKKRTLGDRYQEQVDLNIRLQLSLEECLERLQLAGLMISAQGELLAMLGKPAQAQQALGASLQDFCRVQKDRWFVNDSDVPF